MMHRITTKEMKEMAANDPRKSPQSQKPSEWKWHRLLRLDGDHGFYYEPSLEGRSSPRPSS